MTRINLIPPKQLIRQHLVAEYRELPRVFGLVHAQSSKGKRPSDLKIPKSFVLGTGHVTFFYDKLEFLRKRFGLLVDEMRSRCYTVNHADIPSFTVEIPTEWWNDYYPSDREIEISNARIEDRKNANRNPEASSN